MQTPPLEMQLHVPSLPLIVYATAHMEDCREGLFVT